ncbi:MAG: hypothetical protein HWQ35_21680 [Nostoc sp. NMS1]|uniref:hypothetical protein n=1 Tax=unclassified Nostoc TaxID=2593658 RepID=UPI0025E55D54|nr:MULTISPECIES: hypothetical protein [unclassified Nostoc]MBN3909065.1 hypothetical protein [Nostoc sp. NMS1]MBN3992399.1 hypothetical protein [Nostoc sp. NMS2]
MIQPQAIDPIPEETVRVAPKRQIEELVVCQGNFAWWLAEGQRGRGAEGQRGKNLV